MLLQMTEHFLKPILTQFYSLPSRGTNLSTSVGKKANIRRSQPGSLVYGNQSTGND